MRRLILLNLSYVFGGCIVAGVVVAVIALITKLAWLVWVAVGVGLAPYVILPAVFLFTIVEDRLRKPPGRS